MFMLLLIATLVAVAAVVEIYDMNFAYLYFTFVLKTICKFKLFNE